MSRQVRAWLALAAAVVLVTTAVLSSPVSAAVDDSALVNARARLADCQTLRQYDTRTSADRAWADTCIRLWQREVDRLTVVSTTSMSPTASQPPVTSITPTTVPAPTTPPATTTSPPPAGFPNASTTGVPAGVQLRDCGGEQTIRTAGTVIDGCLISGTVHVRADNVTIRRSKLQGGMVDTGDGIVRNTLIEDVEIDGRDASGRYAFGWNAGAVDYSDYTVVRVNAHHTGFGFHLGNRTRVEDSYAHDFIVTAGAHQDAAISNGGAGIALVHNRLECPDRNACSAAIGLFGDWATIADVLVEGNLLDTGGGYCIHAGSDPAKPFPNGTNITVRDNVFGRTWNPQCGFWGPVTSWSGARGNVWQNNTWIDGGTVVP